VVLLLLVVVVVVVGGRRTSTSVAEAVILATVYSITSVEPSVMVRLDGPLALGVVANVNVCVPDGLEADEVRVDGSVVEVEVEEEVMGGAEEEVEVPALRVPPDAATVEMVEGAARLGVMLIMMVSEEGEFGVDEDEEEDEGVVVELVLDDEMDEVVDADADAVVVDAVPVDAVTIDAVLVDAVFVDAVLIGIVLVDAVLIDIVLVDAVLIDNVLVDAVLTNANTLDVLLAVVNEDETVVNDKVELALLVAPLKLVLVLVLILMLVLELEVCTVTICDLLLKYASYPSG